MKKGNPDLWGNHQKGPVTCRGQLSLYMSASETGFLHQPVVDWMMQDMGRVDSKVSPELTSFWGLPPLTAI